MLVSFSVSNFRSFADEATLSLIASKGILNHHGNHAVDIPGTKNGEKVLRTAVLYGANGAGKSNLHKALTFLKRLAILSRDRGRGTGRDRFRFHGEPSDTSDFDIQFIAAGRLLRYGIKVDDRRVVEEWLTATTGNRERVIYERVTRSNGEVEVAAAGLKSAGDKVNALAKVGGPANQSFLATLVSNLLAEEITGDLRLAVDWFQFSLNLVRPDQGLVAIGKFLTDFDGFRRFAGRFLKAASTGVDSLVIKESRVTEDDIRSQLSTEQAHDVLDSLTGGNACAVELGRRDGKVVVFERRDSGDLFSVTIQARHDPTGGSEAFLDIEDESDGTRRLLQLLPVLDPERASASVYFIDEIDRSMHPMLIWEFLNHFLESCIGQSQLIVTTHETNLLDLDLLRRDEIWFVEKDSSQASQMYSLADFKIRKDLEVRKHYLQGRFGAVPFLGDLERIIPVEHAS